MMSMQVAPSGIVEIANINALRNLGNSERVTINQGTLVYVIGYHHSGDQGGGFFIYDTNRAGNDREDFGFHIKSNVLSGIWKRINTQRTTVAQFGALGGDSKDDTEAFQRAMDYLGSLQPPGKLHIPRGVYYLQSLTLRSGVSIEGEFRGSIIRPFPNEYGQYAPALIELDQGYNDHINLEGILFVGEKDELIDGKNQKSNIGMHCFNLDADTTNGGLWYSSFKDIMITGFEGDGIRLVGGTDYEQNNIHGRVNQFLSFENVRIHRPSTPNSRCLYMYGQNAQVNFENCSFDGHYGPEFFGTNIYLESNSLPALYGYQRGPQTSVINFHTCTIQNSDIAVEMHGTYNISIEGSWFENVYRSVVVTNAARGISINRNKFSNAGYTYLLMMDESWVSFKDNIIRQKNPVELIKTGKGRRYFGDANYHEIPGTDIQRKFN